MKPSTIAILGAFTLIVWSMTLSSCVTTRTTITHPDGRVETIETTAPAPGSIEAAGSAAQIAAQLATAKVDSASAK